MMRVVECTRGCGFAGCGAPRQVSRAHERSFGESGRTSDDAIGLRGRSARRRLSVIVFLHTVATGAGCSTRLPPYGVPQATESSRPSSQTIQAEKYSDPLELVNASDGIDQAEAATIAQTYFHRFISGCGYIDVPTPHGEQWWSTPHVGFGGDRMQSPIRVDAWTGGVSFDAPAAGVQWDRSRTILSLDDLRKRLRWTPIHIVPWETEDSSTTTILRYRSILDDALREHQLGEVTSGVAGPLHMEVTDVDAALPVLKQKVLELGAPTSTIIYAAGQPSMTLDKIR